MATITKRRAADGSWRFTAQIRIRREGKPLHTEAKTFSSKGAADSWAKRREVELEAPGALAPKSKDTLGDLIDRYILEFEPVMRWRRSKSEDLARLKRHDIANKTAATLTAQDLIGHVQARVASGVAPSTAGNDLVWLAGVLRTARSVWGMKIAPHIAEDARDACRRLKMVAPSKRRDRRPTAIEIDRLLAYYRASERHQIPMVDIIEFAIASARREAEICALLWSDIDRKASAILVRDVKHPTEREGNHQQAKLTAAALEVIDRQAKVTDRIFPYRSKSIGHSFTRACAMLGIEDLHFHDLRHEGTSRLFEAGYSIPEVAQFTLHRSWKDLQRYANLRPSKLVLREPKP